MQRSNQIVGNKSQSLSTMVTLYIDLCRETLLKSCWNKTPTQRPTAAELVELLSNNPRLITPCVDVPLASVQVRSVHKRLHRNLCILY